MTRIPPAEQLGQLAEQLAMGARQGTEAEDLTSTLVRLGARKLIEELLEAETSDILGGRGRYQRRSAGQQGLRNGYKRRHIDCAEGRLEIEVPKLAACKASASLRYGQPFSAVPTYSNDWSWKCPCGGWGPGRCGCAARTWRRRGLPAVARQRQPAKRAAVGGVRGLQRAGPVGF